MIKKITTNFLIFCNEIIRFIDNYEFFHLINIISHKEIDIHLGELN